MDLKYTRAMVTAILDGSLEHVVWEKDPIFQVEIPKSCPGVPDNILKPSNTWMDKNEYKITAGKLVKRFGENVKKFKGEMPDEILNAGPHMEEELVLTANVLR